MLFHQKNGSGCNANILVLFLEQTVCNVMRDKTSYSLKEVTLQEKLRGTPFILSLVFNQGHAEDVTYCLTDKSVSLYYYTFICKVNFAI